jgi:hypothetical protein
MHPCNNSHLFRYLKRSAQGYYSTEFSGSVRRSRVILKIFGPLGQHGLSASRSSLQRVEALGSNRPRIALHRGKLSSRGDDGWTCTLRRPGGPPPEAAPEACDPVVRGARACAATCGRRCRGALARAGTRASCWHAPHACPLFEKTAHPPRGKLNVGCRAGWAFRAGRWTRAAAVQAQAQPARTLPCCSWPHIAAHCFYLHAFM